MTGQIERFDDAGNEWCLVCQKHMAIGHFHKPHLDFQKTNEKLDELKLNMSPAYIEHCIRDIFNRIIAIENYTEWTGKRFSDFDIRNCEYHQRLDTLEKQGTDINLRLIHKAVETHVENFDKRLREFEDTIKGLQGFYSEYGHRLLNIENAFTEEDIATKPSTLMDEIKRCNKHIERLHKRIDHVEKVNNDPFKHGEQNMPSLSPEAFGILLEKIEKLEARIYGKLEDHANLLDDRHHWQDNHTKRIAQLEANKPSNEGLNILTTGLENIIKRVEDNLHTCAHNNSILCKDFYALEKEFKAAFDQWKTQPSNYDNVLVHKFNQLDQRMDEVCKNFDANRVIIQRQPYKCPVCEGLGNDKGIQQQNPAYEFSMQYASCQSCSGKGIVWG